MWYAPESSLVTSPPFTSPSATALCVYSTIGELKTMSLWGGLDAFRIAVFDGRARGGEQVTHAFPVRIHHGRRSGLAIVDGNALLGGERLELGVIEQADFLAAQVAGDAHLFGSAGAGCDCRHTSVPQTTPTTASRAISPMIFDLESFIVRPFSGPTGEPGRQMESDWVHAVLHQQPRKAQAKVRRRRIHPCGPTVGWRRSRP